MLLLDFADATKNRDRRKKKKKHGDRFNNKIDRESTLSVNNKLSSGPPVWMLVT